MPLQHLLPFPLKLLLKVPAFRFLLFSEIR
jgi:hypothetical protein